jgi:hypothetical protein
MLYILLVVVEVELILEQMETAAPAAADRAAV